MAEGSEKRGQYTRFSATRSSALDVQRAGTADKVVEQLEVDRISNGEFTE